MTWHNCVAHRRSSCIGSRASLHLKSTPSNVDIKSDNTSSRKKLRKFVERTKKHLAKSVKWLRTGLKLVWNQSKLVWKRFGTDF